MKELKLINLSVSNSIKFVNNHVINYPSPSNLNYLFSFGFLAALVLGIQLISGLLLTMYFTPHVFFAFFSVDRIMRDVFFGWIFRFVHANGASMFFFVVYFHIFKNLFYRSYTYPRDHLWYSGVLLLLLLMGTAFMGYVLPWGQMSYWGVTVITNFVTVLPYGKVILNWIWGGFSIDNNTLNRFFMLHYLMPFLISALAIIHILLLHNGGSNNPLGVKSYDNIPLYPYFILKDFFFTIIFFFVFSYFVLISPFYLNHVDNFIEADPLVTPIHIQPEWYFLPYYAILRSIPIKTHGIFLMLISILVLLLLPLWYQYMDNNSSGVMNMNKNKKLQNIEKKNYFVSNFANIFFNLFYFFWIIVVFFLLIIGSSNITHFSIEFGILCTLYYFLFFIFLIPLSNLLQSYIKMK